MKAILTIGHRRYLVPCAKKALAFKEFMEASFEEAFDAGWKENTFPTRGHPSIDVETTKPGLVVRDLNKKSKP